MISPPPHTPAALRSARLGPLVSCADWPSVHWQLRGAGDRGSQLAGAGDRGRGRRVSEVLYPDGR